MYRASLSLAALTMIFLAAGVSRSFNFRQEKHTLTGEFRTHKNFHSRYLPSDRDILVYLPPDYMTNKKRRYPVFYLHDGQNLFDGATSFIKGAEWRIDETAQALIKARAIAPVIIVGIYNTGKDRIDEYTPTPDTGHSMGGKADLYGKLIVEELKPFIDSEYRTLSDAKNTGLGGASLGALASLHLALKYPQTFGFVALTSPSVWWDNRAILREVEALTTAPPLRIWLDVGTKEGGNVGANEVTTKNARALRDALLAKGWKQGVNLKYFEVEGAEHNERAWAERVAPMLKFLFPLRRR